MGAGLSYSEAAALLLIHRGLTSVRQLASALRVSREEAERIVASLEAKGLVERVRGGLLRREKLRLTRRGLDSVPEAAEVLRRASEAALRAAEEARAGARPVVEEELLAVLPALMFLGMLPAWVIGALLPLAPPGLDYGVKWEDDSADEGDYDDLDIEFDDVEA